MNAETVLLAATLGVPAAMLAACVPARIRTRMLALLPLAPVPALAAAMLTPHDARLVLPDALYGATLALDTPGALLLAAVALLWIAAGAFAAPYLRNRPDAERIAPWWLLTLTGNLGVLIAADIASFYLFFAMASLAAYGLVAHNGTASARRAGAVYVGFALLGEACVIMGLVLLAAATPAGSLLIHDAVAALPTSPWRDATLALLLAGFGIKIGLVPVHVWMPLAYSAAPVPAAAVLSGAAVKAGVIGLIRFLPFDAPLPDCGEALAVVGFFSAFYGVVIGITQSNLKTILAYSSVSQMGLVAATLGMMLMAGDGAALPEVGFYAAHHVLVKGGLFLAIGLAAATPARGLWPVLLPAAVIALGLGGLPFTGGALAKLALKAPFGDGIAGVLAALSAAGTTLLMLHFLRRLPSGASPGITSEPFRLAVPWLVTAFAALAGPWLLFPLEVSGSMSEAFSAAVLWAALWPVLLGALLAAVLWRWQSRRPRIPEGDPGIVLDRIVRAAPSWGAAFERGDAVLRRWPVAGVLLLALTVILAAALSTGR